MGITGFYSWVTTNYASSISIPNGPIFFNHIYIDLNYLLHMCTYNSPSIKLTMIKISSMIKEICARHHALDTINICCDGSAPLAKLFLQRSRRLQEARTIKFSSKDSLKKSSIDLSNSSLNFTPGSVFMSSLHEKLDSLKKKLEMSFNVKVNINNLEPGEAEIKIKNLINKNLDSNPSSTHLLVTNDADVLLIISATKIYKSLYVLIKSNQIVSIKNLIELNCKKFGCGLNPSYDFCFLNLLNGNDYLPKVKFITTDRLWGAYQAKLNKHKGLILNINEKTGLHKINSEFLIDILKNLAGKISTTVLKKTTLNDYIYKDYTNYVNGLIWCFHMYFTGKCDYNSYMFEGETGPDPILLMLHLMGNNLNLNYNLTPTKPISNNLCSILLLPNIAEKLIDSKYYPFIEKHSYLYEEEKCMDCQNFYESMSKLNKIYKEKSIHTESNEIESNHTDHTVHTDHTDHTELNKTKKLITNTQKAYTTHKDIHTKLTSNMIEQLKIEYEKFNSV
jgi:hypothetical protein